MANTSTPMTDFVIEINCETGKETIRAMTNEEIAQRDADAAALFSDQQAKAEAETKLAQLGLTIEDLKALVG